MKRDLIYLISAALIVLSLNGCVEEDATDPMVKVAYSVLQTGQFSGIVSERLEVLRDQDAFAELWLAHGEVFSSVPVQPEVNFDQDMVVAVFLGQRATGGYTIAVTEVVDRKDSLLVNLRVTLPGTNCAVTQAFSQPHQMIAMRQSEKMVAFTTVIERVDCPS
jgi:hypothetical protein